MADLIWRMKMQKVTWFGWYLVLGGFGVVDYDPKKLLDFVLGDFWVADYESEIKIEKLKIADS